MLTINLFVLLLLSDYWVYCSSWTNTKTLLPSPRKVASSSHRQYQSQQQPPPHTYLMSTKIPIEEVEEQLSEIGKDKDNDDKSNSDHPHHNHNHQEFTSTSPLSYTLDELGSMIGGTGRAKACWDCYRIGVDPVWFWSQDGDDDGDDEREDVGTILAEGNNDNTLLVGWTRQQIYDSNLIGINNGLGKQSIELIKRRFFGGRKKSSSIDNNIAHLSKITTSPDGTTKLLLKLQQDNLEIETVIIPWPDRQKSTLCVSSQVGCKQACTFCSTGRMGKLRSLTQDEILIQLYFANKICRLLKRDGLLYEINNVVFMGMGEPADNCEAVVPASQRMMDPNLFQLANRRVTISTVAPTPDSFRQLIGTATATATSTNNKPINRNLGTAAPTSAVLAWSVHSTRDDLRRQLVPTTKYSMEELRRGLIDVLQGRSKRQRNIMLEITLLDGVNDNEVDALHLVEFCQPILNEVHGIKLVINLIPWNDIGAKFGPASLYRPPKTSKVLRFQKILFDNNLLCYVRTTRGDEENSACGMLATKNQRK